MTALGHHCSVYYKKYLLDYDTCLIERSRLKSNPAGRSSRISNSAGRLLCVTWFELFSKLATPGRSYARKIRNHSCGGPVEWKKTSVRDDTYVRNGPVEYAQWPDVRTLGRLWTIRAEDQLIKKKTSIRKNTYVRIGPVEYAQSHRKDTLKDTVPCNISWLITDVIENTWVGAGKMKFQCTIKWLAETI